jgi:hypothetical protein
VSSTNRGRQKTTDDAYPTPEWCVHRLLERLHLPRGRWLEPGAGEGALIKAVSRPDIEWTAVELRSECRPALVKLTPASRVFIEDYLSLPARHQINTHPFDVVLANPPYTLAMEFIQASLRQANIVVMLLRLNFLATAKRNEFMRTYCPDVYVLPDRPSFTGNGTDSIEYGWFVWRKNSSHRSSGSLSVLNQTPASERRHKREIVNSPKGSAA